MTVSLCMIVKNEEETLSVCLNSVKAFVDEIVIVDTGSTDRTKEVAKQFTDLVYDFTWIDDFSAARNFAFSKGSCDYLMWLDADDIILEEDLNKLLSLKETLASDVDVVMMKYHTAFDDNGNPTFSYYRGRLFRNHSGYLWQEPVHEYVPLFGNIINQDIAVTHAKKHHEKTDRNLKIYEKRINNGETLSSRGLYYYARELKDHKQYEKAAQYFEAFLQRGDGWVEDCINACGELSVCYDELKDEEKQLNSLFRSFVYDTPRAEICCKLGYYYKNKEEWKKAYFWFSLVLRLEKPTDNWGFINIDCWGYIPALECAVCCDRLGDYRKGHTYNELAGHMKPESMAVTYNREYFKAKLEQLS